MRRVLVSRDVTAIARGSVAQVGVRTLSLLGVLALASASAGAQRLSGDGAPRTDADSALVVTLRTGSSALIVRGSALSRATAQDGALRAREDSGALGAAVVDPARPASLWVAPRAPAPRPAPWWAPVASAVVPGAGQVALGQQRSVAYVMAEAYLLLQAVGAQRDGDRDRQRYRSVASDVARKSYGGSRPVGSWDYYESMEKYLESGAYDMVPGGAVDPETDATTYNGARWLLARETYWRDPNVAPAVGSPEYQRALAFYTSHAVTDDYRWSWRDAQLQQDVYRQTIASANRSYQRAVNVVGLIGANHLVSLIDAYISVRIRRFGGAGLGSLRVDGMATEVAMLGDPADGRRQLRTGVRLVAR